MEREGKEGRGREGDGRGRVIHSGMGKNIFPLILSSGDHVCQTNQCGGETLCVVADGVTGSCECSPRGIRQPTEDSMSTVSVSRLHYMHRPVYSGTPKCGHPEIRHFVLSQCN